jgi:hypothetical protein
MFCGRAMVGKEKWISTYTNIHKKIYEMENVTRMERIEVACELYKTKYFNEDGEEEIIEEIVEEEDEDEADNEEGVESEEEEEVEVDESEGEEDGDEDNEDEEEDN